LFLVSFSQIFRHSTIFSDFRDFRRLFRVSLLLLPFLLYSFCFGVAAFIDFCTFRWSCWRTTGIFCCLLLLLEYYLLLASLLILSSLQLLVSLLLLVLLLASLQLPISCSAIGSCKEPLLWLVSLHCWRHCYCLIPFFIWRPSCCFGLYC